MLRWFFRLFTHGAALAIGFALGVYLLPILTAPPGPDRAAIDAASANVLFTGRFDRNLPGSDFLHWGEGELRLMRDRIVHDGRLAPGPDYKLYLTSEFVDSKEGFLAIKGKALRVGDVKSFNGFILDVPPGVDVTAYTTAVVWCEAFSQFISAAKYR
jgi:Electron transfer DM13